MSHRRPRLAHRVAGELFTQAPFAARKARRLRDRLRVEFGGVGALGWLNLVDLYDARLLARKRNKQPAREVLARIRRNLEQAGAEQMPTAVRELEAELNG